ncbi:hypothetical protein H6P81_016072 [Aristolochia fimbriata]|uniref:Uncharacterized protein n=1 Tax=Aristolochia fimbriata TaxID=158543 RepID=A0AAV7EB26_ARIFI|nr:hypothetical protein H6P81_016072 [Aristolochia fimbriata]
MSTTSQFFVPETDAKPIGEFEFRLRRRPALEFPPVETCQISADDDDDDEDVSTDPNTMINSIQEGRRLTTQDDDQRELDKHCDEDDAADHSRKDREAVDEDRRIDDQEDVELEISKAAGLFMFDDDQVLVIKNGSDDQQIKKDDVEEELEEEDDGFRTPTSLENKIPAIQRCPAAPRKPRSEPSLKRSRPNSTCSSRVRIDVSDSLLHSLFQPLVSDLTGCQSIKKARN